MPYSEQTWANGLVGGTKINAARLQHMEDGIAAAAVTADVGTPGTPSGDALRAAFDARYAPVGAAGSGGLAVASTVTAAGALVSGKHNPVDATSAALTMTLPVGAAAGTLLAAEKTDASANAVTVSGNMRGASGQTIQLLTAHEVRVFVADSAGSWWPIADHRTKSSLDATYTGRPGGTSAAQAKLPFYNVRDFGAVGDGTTDDTAAFTAAMTAASAANRRLVVPATTSFYKVTNVLPISKAGLMIEGAGGLAKIKQATANKNLFELHADSTYLGLNIIAYVTFANLELTGPGRAAGTGVGIWTDPTPHTPTVYQGQTIRILNTIIEDFDIGVLLYYIDNSYAETLQTKRCRIGWSSSGGANTIHLINCASSSHSQVGYYFGDGCGVTMHGGDSISSPRMLEVDANGQVALIGTNFENNQAGTEFVQVDANGSLVSIGSRFALDAVSGGADVTRYRVAGGGRLVVIAPQDDSTATTPLITKSASTAIVNVLAPQRGLSAGGSDVADGATLSRGSMFDLRQDNSVPSAAQVMRGATVEVMGRDSTTAEDRLVHYIRRYNGTANSFEAVDLTDPRYLYSTSGAAGARIDGIRHHVGRTNSFTTAAAAKTDVTVTVGTFTTLLSATATVSVEGGTPTGPVSVAYKTNSAGVLTFTVFHPSDAAGGLSWRLHYRIDVVT